MDNRTSTGIRLAALAMVLVGTAACGADGDAAAEVASLEESQGSSDGSAAASTADTTPTDPEDAFLAYTECMREHGIDLPDPEIRGGGGGVIAISEDGTDGEPGGAVFDPGSTEFKEAEEACGPLLEAAMGDIEIDPEQEAEMREQMLEFAECMREHGIDFPDPVFGENGRVEVRVESTGGPMEGDREALEEASEACGQDMGGPFAVGSAGGGEG